MFSILRFAMGFAVVLAFSSGAAHAFQGLALECLTSGKNYAFSEIKFVRYVDARTKLDIGTASGTFVGETASRDFKDLIQLDEVCVIRQKVRFECRGASWTDHFQQVQFRKGAATVTWSRTYPIRVDGFRTLQTPSLPLHQAATPDALCVFSAE